MLLERTLHIGSQSRILRCSSAATIIFKKWQGMSLRDALLLNTCDPGTVATAIAAFLYRPGEKKNGSADEKTGPMAVAGWIDAELERYPEFEAAVLGLAEEYFIAAKIVERPAVSPGEAVTSRTDPPPGTSSTSGSPSSASQGGGASTPGTSGT